VLVCGGRNYRNSELVNMVLSTIDAERTITLVIHGNAPGADTLGKLWGQNNGKPVHAYPADCHRHGRRAGVLRNAKMLRESEPDLGIAFPGGPGTADMITRLKVAKVPVLQINEVFIERHIEIIAKVLAAVKAGKLSEKEKD